MMFRSFFVESVFDDSNIQEVVMLSLIQEVHRREQEIVEKNQNLVEMKRKNQTVSIVLTVMMSLPKLDESKSGKK